MFYRSSAGTDGKVSGEWYPFYGMAQWVIKDGFKPGTKQWIFNKQASPELQAKLKKAADRLNKVFGPAKLENFEVPVITTNEQEINTIIGSPVKEGSNFDNRASDPKVAEELRALRKQVAEEGFIPKKKSTQPATEKVDNRQIDMFENQNTLINKNGGTLDAANKSCGG